MKDNIPNQGFNIMIRIPSLDEDRITHRWQRGTIRQTRDAKTGSSNSKEADIWLDHLKIMTTVVLGPDNCGDGSEEGKCWFRVVNKKAFAAAAQKAFTKDENTLMVKYCLTKGKALDDGHCYRRALLTIIFGIDSDTPERLQQFQNIIAAALDEYAEDLDKFVGDYKEPGVSFEHYCRRRANTLRQCNSKAECKEDEWGGGENGCDNLVIARLFQTRVVLTTPGQAEVTVYNGIGEFKVTEVLLSKFEYLPGDLVLSWVCHGTHFIPYLWRGSLCFLLYVESNFKSEIYFPIKRVY